jgi:hypothetical protein
MFALSAIESFGSEAVRLAADDDRWAAAVVFPGRLVVPCGDAEAIAAAGSPARGGACWWGTSPPATRCSPAWATTPS